MRAKSKTALTEGTETSRSCNRANRSEKIAFEGNFGALALGGFAMSRDEADGANHRPWRWEDCGHG
jgi:hypothetical protein